MTFELLEFRQGVVDLAASAQAIDAVRVLRGHELVLVVIDPLQAPLLLLLAQKGRASQSCRLHRSTLSRERRRQDLSRPVATNGGLRARDYQRP
jgi:hypothetical protein